VAFTDGAHAIASARTMRLALSYARAFGTFIVQHPEEPSLAHGAATEGELATRLGLPGIPMAAEAMMVARDIALARLSGGHVHFSRVSTAAALGLIRAAKAEGLAVTCDTAPPYFDLNENAITGYRSYAKLSPPLRPEEERRAVVAGLPAEAAHRGALVVLKAGIAAAVALEEEGWLNRALRLLPGELERQFFPDGGHVERSPAQHLAALQDLIEIRNLLHGAGANTPAQLGGVIERACQALHIATRAWTRSQAAPQDGGT
jgi:hypothetical protein